MKPYPEALEAVSVALAPIAAYCDRAHNTADATDPKQSARFRHVAHLEELIDAVADFGSAAEALRQGYHGSPRITAFCEKMRERMALVTAPPPHLHHLAVLVTSHCLPLPAHARPL